jgi:hypothetical protein
LRLIEAIFFGTEDTPMHLRYAFALAALVAVVVVSPATAATQYSAVLNGLQEVPPNASPATGSGDFVLNDAQTSLSYNVSFSGLVAPQTAAHIHNAPVGVNGPVVFPFAVGSPQIGDWAIPADMVVELQQGELYVNVHSTTFPGGEIRGQILPTTGVLTSTWGRIKGLYSPSGR